VIKVLHVDDNVDDLELTRLRILQIDKELQIESAESVAEALQKAESDGFDCILSDYQMPDMNGLEFLQALRDRGVSIPFIFLTGQGNWEKRQKRFATAQPPRVSRFIRSQ